MKAFHAPSRFLAAAVLCCSLLVGETSSGRAPWFEKRDCPSQQKIHAQSDANRLRYNESGKATRSLWGTGTATCVLYLHICGDRIFSGKEINLDIDEPCPPELQSEAYAGKTVCCEEWTQAKQTNTPCNPLADADCDGIKNQGDTAPIAGGK